MEAAAGLVHLTNSIYNTAVPWAFNSYALYSFSIDYVTLESQYHPNSPAFTSIVDGDLDGDGIPNFLDPDNDGDDLPDSADTDDDNDGILDMFDPMMIMMVSRTSASTSIPMVMETSTIQVLQGT